jgi:hypothetical protein
MSSFETACRDRDAQRLMDVERQAQQEVMDMWQRARQGTANNMDLMAQVESAACARDTGRSWARQQLSTRMPQQGRMP